MKIKVGTRGSKLALAQTHYVVKLLQEKYPQLEFEVQVIQTKGDQNLEIALHKMLDKGIFVKEIEQQLMDNKIDLAIHSMKDMPTQLPKGLCVLDPIVCEDARDVILLNPRKNLTSIKECQTIATSSLRRTMLLHTYYPHIQVENIRGNLDTRIHKMEKCNYDGIILAAAGLHRLNYQSLIHTYLDPTVFVPACAQGILAVEIDENKQYLRKLFDELMDPYTKLRVESERSFLKTIEGGCQMPIGAYLKQEAEGYRLYGVLGDASCKKIFKGCIAVNEENAKEKGRELALQLLSNKEKENG